MLREYGEAGEAYLPLGRSLHAQGRFEESADTRIVVLDDGRERDRDFDFIHTDTVRQSSRDSSLLTETSCQRCDDSLPVLGAVLQKARGL